MACFGGHGRIGTLLAILAALADRWAPTEVVSKLRARYCVEGNREQGVGGVRGGSDRPHPGESFEGQRGAVMSKLIAGIVIGLVIGTAVTALAQDNTSFMRVSQVVVQSRYFREGYVAGVNDTVRAFAAWQSLGMKKGVMAPHYDKCFGVNRGASKSLSRFRVYADSTWELEKERNLNAAVSMINGCVFLDK